MSHWRCRVLLPALLAAATLVPAAPADAKPAPDLTVRSVKIQTARAGPPYVFVGGPSDGLIFDVTVRNVGDMPRAGAGKLLLSGLGALKPARIVFKVPRLRPGRSAAVSVEVGDEDLIGITRYRARACASTRKDTKHGNDCRRGPGFAGIPRVWTGRTEASYDDGLVRQSLIAPSVRFAYSEKRSEAEGLYVYIGSGPLTASITADSDPRCTYSGSGDVAISDVSPSIADLRFDTDLLNYRALGVATSVSYPAQASCDDGGDPFLFEQEPGIWLTTANVARDSTEEFLTGSHSASSGDSWSWNLTAE